MLWIMLNPIESESGILTDCAAPHPCPGTDTLALSLGVAGSLAPTLQSNPTMSEPMRYRRASRQTR